MRQLCLQAETADPMKAVGSTKSWYLKAYSFDTISIVYFAFHTYKGRSRSTHYPRHLQSGLCPGRILRISLARFIV